MVARLWVLTLTRLCRSGRACRAGIADACAMRMCSSSVRWQRTHGHSSSSLVLQHLSYGINVGQCSTHLQRTAYRKLCAQIKAFASHYPLAATRDWHRPPWHR